MIENIKELRSITGKDAKVSWPVAEMLGNISGIQKKVVATVATTFKRKAFMNVVHTCNIQALVALPGIGEKTAMKIIESAKCWLDDHENDSGLRCKPWHYQAQIFTARDALSKEESKLFAEAKACKGYEHWVDFATQLNDLERRLYKENSVVEFSETQGEWVTLPESMNAHIMGIHAHEATDKVAIIRHCEENMFLVDDLRPATAEAIGDDLYNTIRSSAEKYVVQACKWHLARLQEFGFKHGEMRFFYHTSSSGQLKKGSFYATRSDVLEEFKDKLFGGLTADKIQENLTKNGWENLPTTKILQMWSLGFSKAMPSSRVLGRPMLLSDAICVKEYKKMMSDYVWTIKPGKRDYIVQKGVNNNIENSMFDGWVMFDSSAWGAFAAQARGFGIKCMMVGMDYHGYNQEMGYTSPDTYKITDVDGVTHDIEKEKKTIILNTSAFKMLKYYGSWHNYVSTMEALGLTEFYFCEIDEKKAETKRLSRQMTNSLFDLSKDEIKNLVEPSLYYLRQYNCLEEATQIIAEEDRRWDSKSNLAKVVSAYPAAMAMPTVQEQLAARYTKQMNEACAGELVVNGRYFFAVSDPTAMCDIIFGKKAPEDNIGHIPANECVCRGYSKAEKLIALRSPHAFQEWALLKQTKDKIAQKYLTCNVIYFSIWDLCFRKLQMDFDGDHILVINKIQLWEAVDRLLRKYNIPTLYYLPTGGSNFSPWSDNAKEKMRQVCRCISICRENNKVGQYSNLVTSAWSTFRADMSEEAKAKLLEDIAKISAGINFAVDSSKTFAKVELPKELIKRYKTKPYNQRYKGARQDMPSDDPRWDEILMPKGEGIVDSLEDYINLPKKLSLDVSGLNFNPALFINDEYRRQVPKIIVFDEQLKNAILSCKSEDSDHVRSDVQDGCPVSPKSIFTMLMRERASKNTFDDFDKDLAFVEIVRKIMVKVVREALPDYTSNMDDAQVDEFCATWVWNTTFRGFVKTHSWPKSWTQRCLIDVYGDVYANNIMLNLAKQDAEHEDSSESISDEEFYGVMTNVMDDVYSEEEHEAYMASLLSRM